MVATTNAPPTAQPAARRTRYVPGTLSLEAAAVGILLVAALVIRLPHLALVPRFTDESLEVLWSLEIARGRAFPLTNYDAYYGALFNYLVAAVFALAGPSALAARAVVLTTGVLTVGATYALGRAVGGHLTGLVAAALLAVSGAHVVINSHIAWANCTTPLFTTLAALTLYRAVDGFSSRQQASLPANPRSAALLVTAGLIWGLALQTHPLVATMLPGALLFMLWKGRATLRTPWPYLAGLAFLIGYGNVLLHNAATGLESLTTAQRLRSEYVADEAAAGSYPEALGMALLMLGRLLGGAVDARDWPTGYLLDLPVLLGSLLALAGLVQLARRGNPLPLLVVLSCALLLPALNPKLRTLITSRYLMPLAPILLVSSAFVITDGLRRIGNPMLSSRRRLVTIALRGSLLVLMVGQLPPLVRYYERAYASHDTNERAYFLAGEIRRQREATDVLVVDESFGSEGGAGVSELRALRYLLAFDDVPVRVIKITAKRIEDELSTGTGLVVVSGRQLRDLRRLNLVPLTRVPQRGSEYGLFRLVQ